MKGCFLRLNKNMFRKKVSLTRQNSLKVFSVCTTCFDLKSGVEVGHDISHIVVLHSCAHFLINTEYIVQLRLEGTSFVLQAMRGRNVIKIG